MPKRTPRNITNTAYKRCLPIANISISSRDILKLKKCVKYGNERTDDVTLSTQYYMKYIKRAILVNLRQRILILARLIVLQETHVYEIITLAWQLTLFQSLPTCFKYFSDFHRTLTRVTYLYAGWIIQMGHNCQRSKWWED